MRPLAALTALIVSLSTAQAAAQQAAAPAEVRAAEYAARRDSLLARLGDGAAVVAFGERAPIGFPAFYQVPAFRYLTGFLEPDAAPPSWRGFAPRWSAITASACASRTTTS